MATVIPEFGEPYEAEEVVVVDVRTVRVTTVLYLGDQGEEWTGEDIETEATDVWLEALAAAHKNVLKIEIEGESLDYREITNG